MTGLGAIVLAYGDGPWRGVVAQLLEQGVGAGAIVVAHNPREPGEPDLVAPDGVRVLRMSSNRGYAPAMNAAIAVLRAESAELVLLLTHDVELEPGCVATLRQAARRHPRAGVLAPRLRWRDGEGGVHQETFGGWVSRDGATRGRETPQPFPGAPDLAACETVDGAVLLARAEALDAAEAFRRDAGPGPLDERFFMYFEETELCWRVRGAGFDVACVLDAIATQEAGVQRRPGAMGYLMLRNGLEFTRLAAGAPGVARQLPVRLRLLPWRRALAPGIDAVTRRWARAWVVGGCVGLLAFALRRFGPPPGWLPGMGDVRVGSG